MHVDDDLLVGIWSFFIEERAHVCVCSWCQLTCAVSNAAAVGVVDRNHTSSCESRVPVIRLGRCVFGVVRDS